MADIKPMTGATQMIAATALRAQQARMRVIAENMANAQSVSRQPGGDPYRRQVPVFTPYKTDAGQGVRVARVELRSIDPPPSIQDSMEKQMRADREKRAIILTAEGQREAAITTAQGAKQAAILDAEGNKRWPSSRNPPPRAALDIPAARRCRG